MTTNNVTHPFAAAIALLMLGACAGDAPDDEGFYEELQALDYRNFDRAPGYEQARTASTGPHGKFVDIYINDIMATALQGDAIMSWPDGALVVKDGWDTADTDQLHYLAAMEKRGDRWYWAEYDGAGTTKFAGLEESTCTGCHDAGDDGVLAFNFPQ